MPRVVRRSSNLSWHHINPPIPRYDARTRVRHVREGSERVTNSALPFAHWMTV